jgi:hypothetical protein
MAFHGNGDVDGREEACKGVKVGSLNGHCVYKFVKEPTPVMAQLK